MRYVKLICTLILVYILNVQIQMLGFLIMVQVYLQNIFSKIHYNLQTCTNIHKGLFAHYFTTKLLILCTNEYAGYGLWICKLLCELYYSYYRICNTFGGDFNLAVLWFWLRLPNLMYTNTTCNHVYYEASWNHVCLISPCLTNVPICQSYCFPNILCMRHVVHKLLHEIVL